MAEYDREEWRQIIAEAGGVQGARFDALWAEFQEFKALVERSACELGIPQPSKQFSAFGLAMLAAKDLGVEEAVESLVWGRAP